MVSGPSGINVPTGAQSRVRASGDSGTLDTIDESALGWLGPVLSTLLPANGELPPAGDMGLQGPLVIDAHWSPEDFASSSEESRVETLSALEAAEPRMFANIVNLAYNAYYTDARVLALVEEKTGFTATPPQPLGYDLEPFDPAVLATTAQREPFWRRA
jgi:hypothetical protein